MDYEYPRKCQFLPELSLSASPSFLYSYISISSASLTYLSNVPELGAAFP